MFYKYIYTHTCCVWQIKKRRHGADAKKHNSNVAKHFTKSNTIKKQHDKAEPVFLSKGIERLFPISVRNIHFVKYLALSI